MKIIGICGSPRNGGNTETMVRTALKAAKEGLESARKLGKAIAAL